MRPKGWLLDQLGLQARGLTGNLEELWPDVGPRSAWLGGDGEDWERGPYYLDGLVPLAHLLDDDGLKAKADRWVESILRSQRQDGSFGPATNDDWWPRMVALKALTQRHEATGDDRILGFVERYLRFRRDHLRARPLEGWGRARGADEALSILWLGDRTGDRWVPRLGELVLAQTADWGGYLSALPCQGPATSFDHMTHVVNVAMGLKTPAMRYLIDGSPDHLRAVDAAFANLDRFHGQVQGMFSGDEWLAGTDPHHGVELCAVVELMFTLEQLVRVFGGSRFGDRLETIAYNALAATCTAGMTARQYHQQPNQVLATIAPRDWTFSGDDANIFALEPNFGCCTANMHQGWPKLVASLWMGTPDGGLAAVAYGPSSVTASVVGGTEVTIDEDTSYPFADSLLLTVRTPRPVTFPLSLRIPGWCARPRIEVNRSEIDGVVPASAEKPGFVRVERRWHDGDLVALTLPMQLRSIERPRGAIGLALGPLVLALDPGEIWERLPGSVGFGDWEVRNRSSWNFALELDPAEPAKHARVHRLEVGSPPFALVTVGPRTRVEGAAVRVDLPARRLPEWGLEKHSAAPPPHSPVRSSMPTQTISLVPYGNARLRIAEFPWLPRA